MDGRIYYIVANVAITVMVVKVICMFERIPTILRKHPSCWLAGCEFVTMRWPDSIKTNRSICEQPKVVKQNFMKSCITVMGAIGYPIL